MKKIFISILLLFISSSAYAIKIDNSCDGKFGGYVNSCKDDNNIVALKVDAPNLVVINDDVSIGTELHKDFNGTKSDEGWAFMLKATLKWTLLDLRKKE